MTNPSSHFCGVIKQLNDFTRPMITGIYGTNADRDVRPFGSGTFLRIHGETYLVTAHHVIKDAHEAGFDELAHSTGGGGFAGCIDSPFYLMPSPLDLAAARIAPELLNPDYLRPATTAMLANSSLDIGEDILFVHGWPGGRSKYFPVIAEGIVANPLPYASTQATKTSWPAADSNLHIAMHYSVNDLIDEDGNPMKDFVPLPGGMSGSAVWRANWPGNESRWSPELARIIGVVHRWDQDAQCLIATRVEHLRDFLQLVATEESAYLHWLSRGQPIGDDWTDWFAAERSIAGLADN